MHSALLAALFSLFALAQGASVVPIGSSSVNLKQSGQDYSYTINENHGVAIEPLPMHGFKLVPSVMKEESAVKDQPQPEQPLKSTQVAGMVYQVPIAPAPTYTYLPAHQYPVPYPYGINYPYNVITTI